MKNLNECLNTNKELSELLRIEYSLKILGNKLKKISGQLNNIKVTNANRNDLINQIDSMIYELVYELKQLQNIFTAIIDGYLEYESGRCRHNFRNLL